MAAGLPLVASDLPSLREILEDGVDAVLVPPDDPAELAKGIGKVAGDPTLRGRLGKRLLSRAAQHTWDARAERILDWMEAGA
jgi:glycosyltransferase involved in cell wall biosynthesis